MAERIYVLFGVEAPGDPRNIVLYGVSILSIPHEGDGFDAVFA